MTTASNLGRLLVLSWGIWRIPHLKTFVHEATDFVLPYTGGYDAVAGWGRKLTSTRARALAEKKTLPYIALEDGFLRSYGLGVDGAPRLSMLLDRTGIYYDSTRPSDLETMLRETDFSTEELARARRAMDWMRHEKLTKYNKGLLPYKGRAFKRLIVDQTAGDASVQYSGASVDAFECMIEDSLAAFDAKDIAVKLHPDTLTGKKGGYLRELSQKHDVNLITTPVNPWDLFAACDEVATISSQLGFEALMAGKSVHCYGLPFYAGWGLTQDKISCGRRGHARTVEDIFAAAYLRYARYVDPFTGGIATLEDTIGLMSDLVRREKKTSAPSVAVGFSPWRMYFTRRFSGPDTGFARSMKAAPQDNRRVIAWASRRDKLLQKKRLPADMPVTLMEDGFVRSRGLGAKLAFPWSLVLDDRGIYYDPRTASDLEHILQHEEMPEGLLVRAAGVRDLLVNTGVSKYNTGQQAALDTGVDGRCVILVPGQVEDDASIMTGTEDICTNFDLLKAVRKNNPDAYILYKPHPDVEAGKRKGGFPNVDALQHCDKVLKDCSISSLWPVVDEVHAMTSLTGFEALLRDKTVAVYGKPFYAGWGLTKDFCNFPRRTRHLNINQLVAGALLLYPLYFDWKTKQACNIETVIRRLAA
ncbi:MAG: capsular polysaccharide biosynthesis protein [Alphaproteobacteria bacterium]|nr:capsular polysaccharide biosynthesis protein [Alphaproteobacteria bacterium]